MTILKCKMCGGTLEITEGMTVCECEYCGTMQTLPKTNNEQNLNMINRANHFRQQCEFDKAMEIYERILVHSEGDAEIYWSLVLCRYGIEYVDDPLTKKKIPTCHRTQFKSILDDADYLEALSHADTVQKSIYISEAEYIDNIQKGILEISNKEEPFDVFICYKESDANGRRTQDSVLAQDLYYQLTREGFKVFFSRITLEDKLGTEYEPYIFAALNSSRVMVVVGTKPEYFNAVWVKNEWSRFLMLMQENKQKTLIPAYKDMDPYDLPDALSMFQAQDMSKLGFMQDLIRGINKLATVETPIKIETQSLSMSPVNSNVENLLKRGLLSLEDKKWMEANSFFEQVLNENVEEPRAYLGKLMVELKVCFEEDIPSVAKDFSDSDNYRKASRFGDKVLCSKIEAYNNKAIYNGAVNTMNDAADENAFRAVKKIFISLGNFDDSPVMAEKCEECAKECIYQRAKQGMNCAFTELDWKIAMDTFNAINGYKDADELSSTCKEYAEIARTNESMYTPALELIRSNSTDDVENGIHMLERITGYRNSEAMLIQGKKQLRRIQYQAKMNVIDTERKALYSEFSTLGIFAKKKREEIQHRLRQLANEENTLKDENIDLL